MNTLKRFCVLALCVGIFMVPNADAQAHSEKDLAAIVLQQLLIAQHKHDVFEHHGHYYKYVNGRYIYVKKQPYRGYSKHKYLKHKYHKNKYYKNQYGKHHSRKRH